MTTDQAAQLGSQLTGLPYNFVLALINEEGSWGNGNWTNGSIVNNPFDVTSGWASQAGYGANVTGQGGSQGNIASFNDPEAAVRAWAQGINTFSNYAALRAHLASGADVPTLAQDLANAGYAGDSSTFVKNIVTLFNNLGGWITSTAGSIFGKGSGSGQTPLSGTTPLSGIFTKNTSNSNPVVQAQHTAVSVAGSIGGVATALGDLANSVGSSAANLANLINWLGQPNIWLRLILLLVGIILTIVGLVFFAMSFGVKPPLPPAAKLAAAVA